MANLGTGVFTLLFEVIGSCFLLAPVLSGLATKPWAWQMSVLLIGPEGGAAAGTNFRDTLQVRPCKLGIFVPENYGPGS